MDRRSWLWRRKSSEKSPGETESSGSISSHSERFSDDQVYAAYNSQSSEVSSKVVSNAEETNDNVRSLKEKLSSALLNIRAKEDLVKQHAKVAEEAVAGWEKAEAEVLALKQQLEAAIQKSSSLEDRAGHLDGALKECVRQLRQAKLETATTEAELDLCAKLEAMETVNSSLKRDLLCRDEEVKVRTIERDLSTQTAEAASKQHLEDLKKIAKLEAECKTLKAIARKSSTATDCKSFAASSVYVEIDSCRVNGSSGRNKPHSVEIGLMDDFLEMEKFAALADTETETLSDHKMPKTSQGKLKEAEMTLRALQTELAQAHASKVSVEEQLKASNTKREVAESQLRIVKAEIENLHSRISSLDEELQKERDLSTKTLAKCEKIEDEVKKERASASETRAKCRKLEAEVLRMKQGVEMQQEKELAVAASKFAECQKTIASLGRQLKSLASLEDFLLDEKSSELSPENGVKPQKPHLPKRDPELLKPENSNDKEISLALNMNAEPENIRNGTGKRLPRGRSRIRKERLRE